MAEGRIRSLRPHVHTLDRPGEFYRPAVLWATAGAWSTIRVGLVGGPYRDYAVATSSLLDHAIGSPVVVKFTSEAFTTIVSLHPALWGGNGPGGGTKEREVVERGEFRLCCLPRELTVCRNLVGSMTREDIQQLIDTHLPGHTVLGTTVTQRKRGLWGHFTTTGDVDIITIRKLAPPGGTYEDVDVTLDNGMRVRLQHVIDTQEGGTDGA